MTLRVTFLALAITLALVTAASAETAPTAIDLARPESAVAAVESAVRATGKLDAFDHGDLHKLAVVVEEGALRLQLLRALAAGGLTSPDPFVREDWAWSELALREAERGAAPGRVLAILKRLRSTSALLMVRLDPRLAEARRLDDAWFDPKTVATRELAELEQLSLAHPRRLEGLRQRAELLRRLGRPAAALRLVDDAIARAVNAPAAFEDIAILPRVRAERAHALWQLGEFDRALDEDGTVVLAAERAKDYDGWADLVLVRHLSDDVRLVEALRAIDYFKYPGEPDMADWVAAQAACVNFRLHRTTALRLDFEEMWSRDGPSSLPAQTYALLCLGELDEAAKLYKIRLSRPNEAPWAIHALSARARPAALSPSDDALLQRQAAIAARPDIQAALVKVGGARATWLAPIHGEVW